MTRELDRRWLLLFEGGSLLLVFGLFAYFVLIPELHGVRAGEAFRVHGGQAGELRRTA